MLQSTKFQNPNANKTAIAFPQKQIAGPGNQSKPADFPVGESAANPIINAGASHSLFCPFNIYLLHYFLEQWKCSQGFPDIIPSNKGNNSLDCQLAFDNNTHNRQITGQTSTRFSTLREEIRFGGHQAKGLRANTKTVRIVFFFLFNIRFI